MWLNTVLIILCLFPRSQSPTVDQPEFIRILSCAAGDRNRIDQGNTVAVDGFWFVGPLLSVPANRIELLLHRSGKIIKLCEGSYDIQQLRGFVRRPPRCSPPANTPVNAGGCPRVSVPHIPKLTTTWNSFVYSADSVVIYFRRTAEVEVYVTNVFGEPYDSLTMTTDAIRVPVRLDGPREASRVTFTSLNTFDDVILFRPAREKISTMDQLMAKQEKETSNASVTFRQMARAYLLGANGYELEALMILHNLQEENKDEVFFREAYGSLRELVEGR